MTKKSSKKLTSLFVATSIAAGSFVPTAVVIAEETREVTNGKDQQDFLVESEAIIERESAPGTEEKEQLAILEEIQEEVKGDSEPVAENLPVQKSLVEQDGPSELTPNLLDTTQGKSSDWSISGTTLTVVYDTNDGVPLADFLSFIPVLSIVGVTTIEVQVLQNLTTADNQALNQLSWTSLTELHINFSQGSSFTIESGLGIPWCQVFTSNGTTLSSGTFQGAISLTDIELAVNESQFANIHDAARQRIEKLTLTSTDNLTIDSATTGLRSFANLEHLTADTITVGNAILVSMGKLESVNMPNATSFGNFAFTSASSLREVSLPNVTSFGSNAFSGASSLREVSLPNVTSFDNAAFFGASSLTEVSLPNVTSFIASAFSGASSLREVSLPNVTSFGNSAFSGASSLREVSLPNAISFGASAFFGASSLREVSLPKATSLGNSAFSGASSLTKASLPNVTNIVYSSDENGTAFDGATLLTDLEFGINESQFRTMSSQTRSRIKNLTLTSTDDLTNTAESSTASVLGAAFQNLEHLTANTITIGNGVLANLGKLESVNMPNATTFGNNTFLGASSLTEVSLPKARSFGNLAFNGASSLTEVSLPKAINFGNLAFMEATSLTDLELGVNENQFANIHAATRLRIEKLTLTSNDSLTSSNISTGVRSFTNLEHLTANTVTVVGGVLTNLRNLESVNMPNATNFGDNSFTNASSLTEVSLPKATSFGSSAFSGASSLTEVSLPKATSFGSGAFSEASSLTEVSLPKVTSFGSFAFASVSSLKEVSLPEVTSFGDSAFSGATSLTDLELGVNESQFVNIDVMIRPRIEKLALTSTDDLVISDETTGLRSFTNLEQLKTNTKAVGDVVLTNLTKLKTVEMRNAVTFGNAAFQNATSLTEVSIPNATSFGSLAFDNAASLKEISLPNVTSFGAFALSRLNEMKEINLPSVETFGINAFNNSEVGVIDLPAVVTLPTSSFNSSTIGFVKINDAPTLNYESLFSGKGNLIGIVYPDSSEPIAHSIERGNSLKLTDSSRLYNTENLPDGTYGVQWTKHNVVIGEGIDLLLENVQEKHSGDYVAEIWTTNVPNITPTLTADLSVHTVDIEGAIGEVPNAPEVHSITHLDTILTGNGEPDGFVSVHVEGNEIATGVVNGNGEISIEIGNQAIGTEISVYVSNDNGTSEPTVITVEEGIPAPDAPQVNSLTNLETELTGTAVANGIVFVQVDGTEIATGAVDANGDFSIEVGQHATGTEISVVVQNEHGESKPTVITVEQGISAPQAPQVNAITDMDTLVTGAGEAGATVKLTVGGVTIGVGQVTDEGDFVVMIATQEAGTVISVTQQNLGGESVPTEVTVSKTDEIHETTNDFKLGYWQSYGLVVEGQVANEAWDLSSKSGLQGSLQLANEEGVVEASSPIASTNWYDSSQYNGYQGIIDTNMLESLSSASGIYELRIILHQNGVELANEAIQLSGISGRSGLLQNFTTDFLSLQSNHIGSNFLTTERKNQTAHLTIEKQTTPIMGLISETVIEEGRGVNGFILNADFDFSQEHQKNVIIETKTGEEIAVLENIHTWDLSNWGLGVANLDMLSGFQVIIPTEYNNPALYQYKMTITEPGDLETEHLRLLLDKIV